MKIKSDAKPSKNAVVLIVSTGAFDINRKLFIDAIRKKNIVEILPFIEDDGFTLKKGKRVKVKYDNPGESSQMKLKDFNNFVNALKLKQWEFEQKICK